MRSLILGLGNAILGDDAVGLRVARAIAERWGMTEGLMVAEEESGGLALVEQLAGFDRVLLVDAIQTGAAPGTLHRLAVDSIPTQRTATAHGINLRLALEVGRRSGVSLPPDSAISILGIEAAEVMTFSDTLSLEVQLAIPAAIRAAEEWLLQEEDG